MTEKRLVWPNAVTFPSHTSKIADIRLNVYTFPQGGLNKGVGPLYLSQVIFPTDVSDRKGDQYFHSCDGLGGCFELFEWWKSVGVREECVCVYERRREAGKDRLLIIYTGILAMHEHTYFSKPSDWMQFPYVSPVQAPASCWCDAVILTFPRPLHWDLVVNKKDKLWTPGYILT